MPHKDFEVEEQQPDPDPITFALAGEKFTCVPVMPYTTRTILQQNVVFKREFPTFIRGCLVEDDEPRFQAALGSKERPVQPATVEAAFYYLLEAYSEREGEQVAPGLKPTPAGE